MRGLIRCSVVRNSSWFKALQDECDALRGMLANTEAVLAEERRSRLAAEKSDKHNAEDARKLAELRRRLASGAHRAKKVEKLLCPSDDAKVGLGLAEAGTLAAKDRREANNRIVELQAQLVGVQGQQKLPHVGSPSRCCCSPFLTVCVLRLNDWSVAGQMASAEAQVEQLKKEKEVAQAAHAQARQELRRLSSTAAANPNSPAGMQRGTVNKSLNPPLFRTVRDSVRTASNQSSMFYVSATTVILQRCLSTWDCCCKLSLYLCACTEPHCGRGVSSAAKVEWK